MLNLDAIRGANISMGVDPLGGAGVHFWPTIAERLSKPGLIDFWHRALTLDLHATYI